MSLSSILLALFLLCYGLLAITNFRFEESRLVLGGLAIAAGVMMFVRREPKKP